MTDGYFNWLCSLACPSGGGLENPPLIIFRELFSKTYHSDFPNDQNRMLEGLALRNEFMDISKTCPDAPEKCTMLEMLLALARRISFEMIGTVRDSSVRRWFLEMLINMRLVWHNINGYHEMPDAEERIDRWLNRDYEADGTGGFFPLISPEKDQRNVELWYQVGEYLDENYP